MAVPARTLDALDRQLRPAQSGIGSGVAGAVGGAAKARKPLKPATGRGAGAGGAVGRRKSATGLAHEARTKRELASLDKAIDKGRPNVASTVSSLGANTKGLGRAFVNTVGAIGEETYHDPIGQAGKAVNTVGEVVKGITSLMALTSKGSPLVAPMPKSARDDSAGEIAQRMAEGTAEHYKKTYGPSFRGEKGAYKKLRAQLREEGVLLPALDVATVVAPTSSALGAGLRTVAKGSAPGGVVSRVAAKTEARPGLKTNALKPATPQKVRPSLVGAGAAAGHDLLRAGVQKAAVKRAARPNAKPLPARRANLKPGEVAPIARLPANRRLALRAAELTQRGETAGRYRSARHVTDRKSPESIRNASKGVAPELHEAALAATQLGIRDSAGAKALLPLRIREIEEARAAATATGAKGRTAATEARAAKGEIDELPQLQAYLRDPSVFDKAEVRALTERLAANPIGAREGLEAARAAEGRSALVGKTLGVPTAAERNAAASTARTEAKASAKAEIKAATAERAKVRAGAERVLSGARADVAALKRPGVKATPAAVTRAEARLSKAQTITAGKLADASDRVIAARAAHAAANKPLVKIKETAAQREAAVLAAAKAVHPNLVAPAHIPSRLEADEITMPRSGPQFDKNPLSAAKRRKGIVYELGRQDKQLSLVEQQVSATLQRGARLEAESHVLGEAGIAFKTEADARGFLHGLGYKTDKEVAKAGLALHKPQSGLAHSDIASARTTRKTKRPVKSSREGDYVRTDNVFVLPKAVKRELDALGHKPSTPAKILRTLAHLPQTALLALNPSWWQFQRVNDGVALAAGGALHHLPTLRKVRKGLSPDAREMLHTMAGGSMSRQMLTPHSTQELGRMQRILDEAPTYRDALAHERPATALLLRAAHNVPTVLLRSDAAITGAAREMQLIHNLGIVGRKMDDDVAAVSRAFGPIGNAFKTGDVALAEKLLTDPRYKAQLEDAAARLYKIHGNWHAYTASEKSARSAFAFYGFLRYATKMALYTLPVQHPYVAGLVAQLGEMGARDAKAIIGPDLPYGLGALYNKDGTIAADLTRANPLLGPAFSITKPEQMVSLATPLAGIALNYITGQPTALSDSSEGYVKQYTARGNPDDHAIGGMFSETRSRIGADQLLSLLGPYREWRRFDGRPQSSDSLPWDRKPLQASGAEAQLKLDAKARAAAGGLGGLAHNQLPLLFPGSAKNMKTQGALVTKAKREGEHKAALAKAKRNYKLNTAAGRLDRQLELLDEQLKQSSVPQLDELDRQLKLLDAQTGG